ncbi:MAG: Holliday junction resolvase RuvX [Candidatus Sumerlaeota bacterium]|nr:Holliday junction resolvase RuvX [Candidatus Sumerlaeota bacterium]
MEVGSFSFPRMLAFDVGLRRIGVARSTALGQGEPLAVLPVRNRQWRLLCLDISRFVREYEIQEFVVGLPFNMDGSRGASARLSEEFAHWLRKTFLDIRVVLEDERLTTEQARERLAEAGVRGRKARKRIDAAAACMIVESRLARLAMEARKAERGA